MNKTKIEWCDLTWNPITGCTAGCPYCYARKIAMRFDGHFKPTFHPKRLRDLRDGPKKSKQIFVGSMGDMFDPGVKSEWRKKVFQEMINIKWHTYYILTKQPQNISDIEILDRSGLNVNFGVSITGPQNLWRIGELIANTNRLISSKRFISFEPLLADVGEIPNLRFIAKVIVGGQTNPTFIPKEEWIKNIERQCGDKIPIFYKSNLREKAGVV